MHKAESSKAEAKVKAVADSQVPAEEISGNLSKVVIRNDFYRDGYRAILKVAVIQGLVIIGLVAAMFYIIHVHQPENRFTSQIGDGAAIAAITGYPVVCDFRGIDVALGGQGTPITPIADKLFFPDYKYLMNLGGISNLTCHVGGKYIAFDITPVNLILNKLAKNAGREYDEGGNMARSGSVSNHLLEELNSSWYYEKDYYGYLLDR